MRNHPKVTVASFSWVNKNDGVPVLASVAAILRPICPDFPIPITTTLPSQLKISWQARSKSVLIYCSRFLDLRVRYGELLYLLSENRSLTFLVPCVAFKLMGLAKSNCITNTWYQ